MLLLLLSAFFLTLGGAAHAFNSYLGSFNTKYGTSATKLNDCITCHTSQGTSTWNPYGLALQANIGLGISAALTAVEPLDSDGDGYTNLAEITARTFPGDPADHPAPSDTTPPTVSSTNPSSGQTGVAVNAAVTATFSEAVKNLSTTTFQLKAGAASVTGTVTLNGNTATFTPSADLAYGTTYTATITTGVTDLANNALAAAYSWSFTTGAAPDTTPPTVSATSPVNGATAVSVSTAVTATFSEAVKNVSTGTFQLKAGAASVTGTVTLNGTTATFTPSASLAFGTTYTATITTGVTDLANNALAAAYSWSFTTGAASDTTPPTVSSTNPASGQTGVAVNATVTATFSEAVKNVSASTFQLKAGATSVTGTVTLNGTTATFTPSANLAYGTTYTATLTAGISDLANNALAAYTWSFSTGAASDTTPPTVSSTNPTNAQTGVGANTVVTANFSEPIAASSVNATTFILKDAAGASVAGVVTANGSTATFTPSAALGSMVTYTATLTTGVKDVAGNALASAYSWSFTTIAAAADSDDDGIDDAEDDYPRDDRKATPRNPKGKGKIEIDTSSNSGTRLRNVSAVSDTASTMSTAGKPAGMNFAYGVLSYEIDGVVRGATIAVTIRYPADIPSGSKAYKVDSSGYHEYSRVSFNGNTMTVTLTDGGAGDSDGSANGVILDPIGLATPQDSPQSAGGGCSISGAGEKPGSDAISYGMLLLLAAAMLGARAATRRRAAGKP